MIATIGNDPVMVTSKYGKILRNICFTNKF